METEGVIYLMEVKGEYKPKGPDVIAKKKCGIQYCEVASHWGKANGYQEWQYLFIHPIYASHAELFVHAVG